MTTKSALPLTMLIELAQKKADSATRRLGQLQTAQVNAKEKLAMLLEYRQEYYDKQHAQLQEGASSSYWRNFQHFIATLDGAIAQQQATVAQAEHSLESGRNDWMQAQRKVSSFGSLAERVRQQHARTQGRREQRDNDEHAARQFNLRKAQA